MCENQKWAVTLARAVFFVTGYQRGDSGAVSTPSSPTSRLLMEYEMHLRNTLAKGMDAESYSLHTFEALLTQSMENLGKIYYLESLLFLSTSSGGPLYVLKSTKYLEFLFLSYFIIQ